MGAREARLSFGMVNARYARDSILVTTNRVVAEWGGNLSGPAPAAALLDRFLYHYHLLNISGESCRIREVKRSGDAGRKRESSDKQGD